VIYVKVMAGSRVTVPQTEPLTKKLMSMAATEEIRINIAQRDYRTSTGDKNVLTFELHGETFALYTTFFITCLDYL
jgi:hypothetical protein